MVVINWLYSQCRYVKIGIKFEGDHDEMDEICARNNYRLNFFALAFTR